MIESLRAIWCVWLRYFAVFRKGLVYYLVTSLTEPALYLLSFGWGVGGLVGSVSVEGQELSYRGFVFAGVIAQTLLFQGFYEGSYGGFIRMHYQKIFQAIGVTPISVSEVLWAELLWGASKAALTAEFVVGIGVAAGVFSAKSLLLILPLSFSSGLLFTALGLTAAAKSRSIDQLSYPQYLFLMPMFLLCGIFYPLEKLPHIGRLLAWCLPLTSVVSIARTIVLDLPWDFKALPILLVWLCVFVSVAHRLMLRRIVH